MKTLLRKNENTLTGYELVTINDQGLETCTPIDQFDPNNPKSLKLPENPSNRKYFSIARIGNEIELTYKKTMTFGPRSETAPRKGLEEYLDETDRELYLQLVEKAKKNREEMNKRPVLTEKEKLLNRIAKLQERLGTIDE